MKLVIALFAAAALLAGCEKKDEGGGAAASGSAAAAGDKKDGGGKAGGTGVKECDDFIAAVDKCGSMPKEAKEAMTKAYKDALNAPGVTDEVKKMQGSGC